MFRYFKRRKKIADLRKDFYTSNIYDKLFERYGSTRLSIFLTVRIAKLYRKCKDREIIEFFCLEGVAPKGRIAIMETVVFKTLFSSKTFYIGLISKASKAVWEKSELNGECHWVLRNR